MLTLLSKEDIALFKDREVDLLIESYSNSTRILQIRGFCEDSQIIADHTTNADRSLASSTVSVTGIPTMLTIRCATTGIKRGACYVKVFLRIEGIIAGMLACGYVTDTNKPQWPGGLNESSIEGPGLIRTIQGTDQAAGVNISETVPTGARWKFKSMKAPLVADATVINRYPHIQFTSGGSTFADFYNIVAHTAGLTINYTFTDQGGITTGGSSGYQNIPTQKDILLQAGDIISTITIGLQAGDNWGVPILEVEEWIEP
jgi:hypothetical protein